MLSAVCDITILAYIIYRLLILIRGTRAVQLIKGLVFLLVLASVSDWLELRALNWILEQFWAVIFVALAVIFQPELRRALEQLGRGQFFPVHGGSLTTGDLVHIIDEITEAVVSCAKTKTGALIVLERDTGLNDYIETGIPIDATVTEELLINIFVVNTPLHDGAAIIRGNRVTAAACFLPLSDNPYISLSLGTRHRAAIGISEVSDCLAVVVSEETGLISLAQDGKLVRHLDEKQLREMLSMQLTISTTKESLWQKSKEVLHRG
ncbi:MAG: diadenylate cyclase CdaA [Clostridiales bacterium]